MVLENLLKDYESSQLPTHGKGNIQNVCFLSSDISVQGWRSGKVPHPYSAGARFESWPGHLS
jgi:hypothetical protein